MILRPMQPADILPCARLMAQSPLWQRYAVTEASAAGRFEQGLSRLAMIVVAEQDGAIAGFIWCEPRGAFARSGYIVLIGVQPDLRSQGVGQALMAHAEGELFSVVDDIFLLVSDFNQGAQRFYQRLGYRQVGSIPDYVVLGVTELIYHKRSLDAKG
jgi:ribosomal protein S18 acetylase RimI-like enzyme